MGLHLEFVRSLLDRQMDQAAIEQRSFHVVVLQKTTKKCTKMYKAHTELLYCSSTFLFSDVIVAFVVVLQAVNLSLSLLSESRRKMDAKNLGGEAHNCD